MTKTNKNTTPAPCRCPGYAGPHRLNSGACHGEVEEDNSCRTCAGSGGGEGAWRCYSCGGSGQEARARYAPEEADEPNDYDDYRGP